ncbi:MAG: SCO family protein [Caldilineaceae bacterium]
MIRQLFLLMVSLVTPLLISGATPRVQPVAQPPAQPLVQLPVPPAIQPSDQATVLSGKVYTPPRTAFDFALPASSGQIVRLSDYRDRVVLLFFGYTSCPDVCPTTLADIKLALAQLGPQAQGVTVLFITVDPAYDTPARLAEYLGYFHEEGYLGLSGSEAETAAIAYQYGAKFYREEGATATGGYSVAHTTRLFLINRQGEWAMTMNYGTPSDQIAANLRYWLIH